MMDINELMQLVSRGEGRNIEFKVDFPANATELAQVMAAFANTSGGTILVGIEDRTRRIVGVANATSVIDRMAGLAQKAINPPLDLEMGTVSVGQGSDVVWGRIAADPKPYLVAGRIYLRIGSTSVHVESREQLIKVLDRAGLPWIAGTRRQESSVITAFPPAVRELRGRSKELQELIGHLARVRTAIIVIEGISGIGKTALAGHLASIAHESSYSSFWLECRQETTLDAITLELARFARNQGNDPVADVLEDTSSRAHDRIAMACNALAQIKYALFLDNYHLILDPKVDTLLKTLGDRPGQTKAILTVRRRPRLTDIGPLPSVAELHLENGLDPGACAELLRDCGLEIDRRTARKVWKLSGRGHPKALQIFAARARTVPIKELLRLPVFREDLVENWLTPLLRELPEDQRSMVVELSIFERSIPLNGWRRLQSEIDIDRLLIELIDRFILDYTRDNTLVMNDLIREFCSAMLQDKPLKHRLAGESYLLEQDTVGDLEIVNNLELENTFAAWYHFVSAGDLVRATEMVSRLRGPLMNRGRYDQVMLLLEQTNPVTDEDADWIAIQKARILGLRGATKDAVELINPRITSSNERLAREAILVLAAIYTSTGKAKETVVLLESNAERFRGDVPSRTKIRFLSRMVQACLLQGDAQKGLDWAARICRACEARNDVIGAAIALRQMSIAFRMQGNANQALPICKLSYDLLQEHGSIREIALDLMELGLIHEAVGDPAQAVDSLAHALESFMTMGDQRNAAFCRHRVNALRANASADPNSNDRQLSERRTRAPKSPG